MTLKTKVNSAVSYIEKGKRKTCWREEEKSEEVRYFGFRERVCGFSLGLRAIRPSEFVGARRKAVLRGEGNAWAPVLRSFNKLREVGVSLYLSFTL